jgi:nicotinamide-nucleotide amidase
MAEMFERGILPDLRRRMAEAGEKAVIVSRVLRTWGTSESALAETLQGRFDVLDGRSAADGSAGSVSLAFLAAGIEGIKVRITARGPDADAAKALLAAEEAEVRAALAKDLGDIVFGVDDETMEQALARVLVEHGLTLGVAESLTGGLIASRLVDVPGASGWFKGGVVAYDSAVKHAVLGVPEGPVVSLAAAVAMAEGARRVTGADVGLGITGVAGPEPQEGVEPGTVFIGISLSGRQGAGRQLRLPGDRPRIRQYSAITALDLLRRSIATPEQGINAPTLG